ncbi:hypothetical protein Q5P01_000253 [Channa striata]|uniref:Uncharacterized protein n=1 Tax=Channa striata TaxID=64152 RepID=A0AA88IQQ6_CHASR|nr:hypothetical protein Q5P01_000253 [Channa striata]
MGDSEARSEQEHPHRVRLSHRDERRAVHVRRRGLHGAAVQALIQGEHRLHNMECAIAVFNIVIAICVVTMVLRPPCSRRNKARSRGQRKGATEIAIAPNSSRDNASTTAAGAVGILTIRNPAGSCERRVACGSSVGGAIELFRNPPVAIRRVTASGTPSEGV